MDAQGDATAIWQRFDGANFVIQAASRPAGGTWQPPVDLSVAGQTANNSQIALDPQGNATAVWQRSNGSNEIVQAASRPAGGTWQPPVDLSMAGQNAVEPQIALDPQGNATAIWWRYNGSNEIVQAASKLAGGVWQAPVDLSTTGQNAVYPRIALDAQGNAVAVWLRSNGTNKIVQAASKPAGGAWQAPVDLSAAGQDAAEPRVAFDPQGNATAVWWRSNGSNPIVQAASKPAGGTWQAPVDLSVTGGNAEQPRLAIGQRGEALAVWRRLEGGSYVIQAASRPVGGTWQAPIQVSLPSQEGSYPEVTLDPNGNATAVWASQNGTNWIVQASGYDASGPQLNGLTIPATGIAGRPLAFSVTPLDVWSALGATGWSFGDGGSASGTSVTHSYAAPGSYQATLTSADALGNTTSTTRTVAIAPAPLATAARVARVKHGKALLKLTCPAGSTPCQGVAKLIGGKGRKGALLGKRAFDIPAGRTHAVAVKLSRKAAAQVRRAGRAGFKARCSGSGVKSRTVVLKPA